MAGLDELDRRMPTPAHGLAAKRNLPSVDAPVSGGTAGAKGAIEHQRKVAAPVGSNSVIPRARAISPALFETTAAPARSWT